MRLARRRLGLTQVSVSEMLTSVPVGRLTGIERTTLDPSDDELRQIADLYGVELELSR